MNCPSGEYITTPDLSTCSTNMEDRKQKLMQYINDLEPEPEQISKNTPEPEPEQISKNTPEPEPEPERLDQRSEHTTEELRSSEHFEQNSNYTIEESKSNTPQSENYYGIHMIHNMLSKTIVKFCNATTKDVEIYRRALINYDNFHKKSHGQTTLKEVDQTSAGIHGWAHYKSMDDILSELRKELLIAQQKAEEEKAELLIAQQKAEEEKAELLIAQQKAEEELSKLRKELVNKDEIIRILREDNSII